MLRSRPTGRLCCNPNSTNPYFDQLTRFVRTEYATQKIFPAGGSIFRAFDKCPFDRLKVVIIGQDPYHGDGQANGLCFSVNDGVAFRHRCRTYSRRYATMWAFPVPESGNLDRWAEQGVLLLNSVLTVRAHQAASHAGHGWEQFTDAVVRLIAERKQGIVTCYGGTTPSARDRSPTPRATSSLRSVHPSPLSVYRGFFGCRHFSQANAYLQSIGKTPIMW